MIRLLSAPLCLIALLAIFPDSAHADRRMFTWLYEPLGYVPGSGEVELYTTIHAVKAIQTTNSAGQQEIQLDGQRLQTTHMIEFEFSPLQRLNMGAYLVFYKAHDKDFIFFRGAKLKAILNALRADIDPVGLGFYLETIFYNDRFELEFKLNVGKRFGPFSLVTNLVLEPEFFFWKEKTELLFKPIVGLGYQVTPNFFVGAELFMELKYEVEKLSNGTVREELKPFAIYLGPTLNWAPIENLWFGVNWGFQLNALAVESHFLHQGRLLVGIPLGGSHKDEQPSLNGETDSMHVSEGFAEQG